MTKSRVGRSALIAFVMASALTAAACSSGKSSSTTGGTSTTTLSAQSSTKSTGHPATGAPIVVGLYAPVNNPVLSAPEMIGAAQAAVRYVNAELGGLAGRPIDLQVCKTDNTPETANACANELLRKHPLFVIPGPDTATFGSLPIYEGAGMPLVGGTTFLPTEFTSKVRVAFQGASASLFPGMAYFAKNYFHAKTIAVVLLENPGASAVKALFLDPAVKALGLPPVKVFTVPTTASDLTPEFGAALNTRPDVILALSLPCAPVMDAYSGLGATVPLVQPSNCSDPATLAQLGAAANGSYFIDTYFTPQIDKTNADVKIYESAIEKYGSGNVALTDYSLAAFATIMNAQRALSGLDASTLTPASVLATFKRKSNAPNFLLNTYDCAHPLVPQYPGLCDVSARLTQVKDGGLRAITDFVPGNALWAVG